VAIREFEYRPPGTRDPVRVRVGPGAGAELPGFRAETSSILVVDAVAAREFGGALEALARSLAPPCARPILLPAGEEAKDLESLPGLARQLLASGLDRKSVMVVAGGGAALDAGLFLAGVWLRGIAAIAVPTTLLAQVDAGLGGKCGFNVGAEKNQIGLVRQPRAILVDPGFLATQPASARASGLGEILKTALLSGGPWFQAFSAAPPGAARTAEEWTPWIEECLRAKAAIVERDPLESGERALLNLGHTLGHGIEAEALRAGIPLSHGECVGLGLLGEAEGLSPAPVAPLVRDLLGRTGLPSRLPRGIDPERVLLHLRHDKKRRGSEWRLPVLQAPGETQLVALAEDALLPALARGLAALA
jgi:3-dehydroquinate synthetase